MQYINYSKDQRALASTTDIASYLQYIGDELLPNGNYHDKKYIDPLTGEISYQSGKRYRHSTHDSLIITGNTYMWNSHRTKGKAEIGDATKLLMSLQGLSFPEAVAELLAFRDNPNYPTLVAASQTDSLPQSKIPSIFYQPPPNDTYRNLLAYLCTTCKIRHSLVSDLLAGGFIYQWNHNGHHKIVFTFHNESAQIVGADMRLTYSDSTEQRTIANSDTRYGFNIAVYGASSTTATHLNLCNPATQPEHIFIFSTAIELLSFIDLRILHPHKQPQNILLIAPPANASISTFLRHTLELYQPTAPLHLCPNNDEAGEGLIAACRGLNIPHKSHRPSHPHKDWNAELVALRTKQA